MRCRSFRSLVALCAAVVLTTAACSRLSVPDVTLDVANPAQTVVYVGGFGWGNMSALRGAELSPAQWAAIYRVVVVTDAGAASMPVAGRYETGGDHVRFIPMFPLDAGRTYEVTFEPSAAGLPALAGIPSKRGRVTVPVRPDTTPPTTVAAVYPGSAEVPANLLRMYIEFSGPMGSRDGQDYVSLIDGEGRTLEDAILPLDTALWNPERTRYTVLFDPGRVKRGILPNRQDGRPLHPGQTFTIVIRRDWPDGHARPLAADFRREFRVGAPIERALDTSKWRITAPAAGSRDPLVVEFPWPLDRGLLQRALAVTAGDTPDAPLEGAARIEHEERRWQFVPAQPWQPRAHALVALPELEDPSGNRVGRPFETHDGRDDTHRPPTRIAFQPR